MRFICLSLKYGQIWYRQASLWYSLGQLLFWFLVQVKLLIKLDLKFPVLFNLAHQIPAQCLSWRKSWVWLAVKCSFVLKYFSYWFRRLLLSKDLMHWYLSWPLTFLVGQRSQSVTAECVNSSGFCRFGFQRSFGAAQGGSFWLLRAYLVSKRACYASFALLSPLWLFQSIGHHYWESFWRLCFPGSEHCFLASSWALGTGLGDCMS